MEWKLDYSRGFKEKNGRYGQENGVADEGRSGGGKGGGEYSRDLGKDSVYWLVS